MELSKFNNTLMFSNKNLEKLASKLINESANAVLMEMFSDKCILADHNTGCIYEADYNFDGKVFTFENFEKVNLTNSNSSLREAIGDFFDDANINLAEAYETLDKSNSEMFESSLTEALAKKNMDSVINYAELEGISEEVTDAMETRTFKLFEERLAEHPTESIKMFNWKDTVRVSLLDEDYNTIVNKSMKDKAKTLKSSIDFKKELKDVAMEAVEGNTELVESFIRSNPAILALTPTELKEAIGLSIIGNKTLMENRKNIVSIFNNVIEEADDLCEKRNILAEEDEESVETDAPEADEQDIEEIKKALEKAIDKATDEKLIKKIEGIISSLEDSADAGETDVSAVKEAVEILSL